MKEYKKILGIDFETANRHRTSACALGLSMVDMETGSMIETKSFLINPHQEFDEFNIMIHHITPEMVKDAPAFDGVLPEIAARIDDETLVCAHNASFDMSVIHRTCEAMQITPPDMDFVCTYALARSLMPGLYRYSLPCVAKACALDAFDHHVASSDASVCALILLNLIKKAPSLADLLAQASIAPGHFCGGTYHNCHKISHQNTKIDYDAIIKNANTAGHEDSLFFGKMVVFTGTLKSMSRNEAIKLVADRGALLGSGKFTEDTNFLICGYQDAYKLRGKDKSKKMLAAEKLAAAGRDIQIVCEEDFLRML